MSELEKSLKEQLESVINQNQMLLEKHYQQDSKIVKLIEENNYYKTQLQQKENIIKEVREYIEKHCKNERISNEVGYACYTMADTNELEHIMKILDKGE